MDKFKQYLKWDRVQKELLNKGLPLFSLREFQGIFGINKERAIKFLSRHKKKGNLVQLKRGLYCLTVKPPSLFQVANRLYQPSYISFETALSFHHLIPETVYAFTSATPRTSQEFEALNNCFSYHKIKQAAFTGYTVRDIEGQKVLIATPEKAVVDFLYFVSLGKKVLNERLRVADLDKGKLRMYASAFEKPRLLDYLTKIPVEEVR